MYERLCRYHFVAQQERSLPGSFLSNTCKMLIYHNNYYVVEVQENCSMAASQTLLVSQHISTSSPLETRICIIDWYMACWLVVPASYQAKPLYCTFLVRPSVSSNRGSSSGNGACTKPSRLQSPHHITLYQAAAWCYEHATNRSVF